MADLYFCSNSLAALRASKLPSFTADSTEATPCWVIAVALVPALTALSIAPRPFEYTPPE